MSDPDDPGFVVMVVNLQGVKFIPYGPWNGTATEGSMLVLPELFFANWDTPLLPKCSLTFKTYGRVL